MPALALSRPLGSPTRSFHFSSTLGAGTSQRGPPSSQGAPGVHVLADRTPGRGAWACPQQTRRRHQGAGTSGRAAEEGQRYVELTLSGTQENFSEIMKGTPSIAAKEERRENSMKPHRCSATQVIHREGASEPGQVPCSQGPRLARGRHLGTSSPGGSQEGQVWTPLCPPPGGLSRMPVVGATKGLAAGRRHSREGTALRPGMWAGCLG